MGYNRKKSDDKHQKFVNETVAVKTTYRAMVPVGEPDGWGEKELPTTEFVEIKKRKKKWMKMSYTIR